MTRFSSSCYFLAIKGFAPRRLPASAVAGFHGHERETRWTSSRLPSGQNQSCNRVMFFPRKRQWYVCLYLEFDIDQYHYIYRNRIFAVLILSLKSLSQTWIWNWFPFWNFDGYQELRRRFKETEERASKIEKRLVDLKPNDGFEYI